MTASNNRVVFMDKNGTIHSSYPEYPVNWKVCVLLHQLALQLLRLLKKAHEKVLLPTNQSGIGRLTEAQLNSVLRILHNKAELDNGDFTGIYFSPSVPTEKCSGSKYAAEIFVGKWIGAKTILIQTRRRKNIYPTYAEQDYINDYSPDVIGRTIEFRKQSE